VLGRKAKGISSRGGEGRGGKSNVSGREKSDTTRGHKPKRGRTGQFPTKFWEKKGSRDR